MRLGIDFGTTRTVVACCNRGNYPLVTFLDPGGDACEWFPSAVAVRGDDWKFGFEALRAGADPTWTLVRSFKRLMGGPDAGQERALTVRGASVPVAEVVGRYLEALRDAILERSNAPFGDSVDRRLQAVVAAPANAHSTQRFLTLDAFRRAGFEVVAMLNEPSAAGFEYTHRHRNTLSSRRDHIVVYDLGGGTFDVSLIRAHGRHHEVITTAGVNRLGGDDFDEALAHLALEAGGGSDGIDERGWARLLERCREAKEALAPQTRKMSIDLRGVTSGGGEVTVPVSDFYVASAPLVEETLLGMEPVLRRADVEGAIDGEEGLLAGELGDVAGIYVVGGASALPLVGRALRERFGRRVHRSPYPFAATALGLAIAADEGSGFSLADRFSRNFGVFREADAGAHVAFDPIFTREAALPAPGAPPLELRRQYRAAHNVGHFRFVECSGVDGQGVPTGDITPLGEVKFAFDPALRGGGGLEGVAIARTGEGPLIQEEYSVDGSGIVLVTISDLDSGYRQQFRIGG